MALMGKKLIPPPVWIMRQAGRYLPEYQEVRQQADFLSLCLNPEMACEITLQPIKRFNLDAAILFSDILLPLVSMGMILKFDERHGPVFENPIRDSSDIQKLRNNQDDVCLPVGQALQLIKKELPENTALLGFAGAPFTLASYMVEGGSSKNFTKIKSLIYSNTRIYTSLMEKLLSATITYLDIQIDNGVEAIQLFDSWAGQLSPRDYNEYVHPYTEQIVCHVENRNTPVILFVKGNAGILETLNKSRASGLGISWDITLEQAAAAIPSGKCLQGNLDPAVLLGERDTITQRTTEIIRAMELLDRPFIFNLGHGILPETPVDNVQTMLNTVRSYAPLSPNHR
jgi:uroporphyrinogen decarboxylase